MSTKDYIFDSEELEIWNDTVKNTKKLKSTQSIMKNTDSKTTYNNTDKEAVKYVANLQINQHCNTRAEVLEFGNSTRINSHMLKTITRGNYKIDKTLDLHGYSREQAYGALINFLDNAHEQKYRMVLVITGKGNKSPQKQSILKNSLLNWLETYNSNDKFLYIDHAHPKHGGDGAVYILLKKHAC